ncbi:T9SS type A sorting domain-containing protein [Chryseobacterium sp. GP-SGM7]|uniref:T9SS type A sorting domain-containing protein n=1 Tax=Chryseobacterium sp. GP-SGM7 TaxID=3411323 RepID=UPI003B93321C
MKKNLLTLGVLAISLSVQAQTVLLHVDDAAKMYVSDGTLVYNGGGVQTRGEGSIDLHGNMMIVSSASSDVIRALPAISTTAPRTGDNFFIRLNDPVNFTTSTYGQLYISGFSQNNITAIVDKEYKDVSHGSFQQIAMPFSNKTIASIATNLGKGSNFTNNRTTNALAYWDHTKTVMRVVNPSITTDYGDLSVSANNLYGPTTYFAVGSTGWSPNPSLPTTSAVRTLKGVPYSDTTALTNDVNLVNGGKPGGVAINYGSVGQNLNEFNERYNTYLDDPFDTSWTTNYGKELYQFGNPFLTNLDFAWIGTNAAETGAVNDGNILPVRGVRYALSNVNYSPSTGTTVTNQFVTFSYNGSNGNVATVVPAGDVDNLIIKPMGTVYVKLDRDLISLYPSVGFNNKLNFNTLRRFSKRSRAASVSYSVAAAKNNPTSSLKQLGVIALDAQDKEISRTYYVVHGNGSTGYSTNYNLQANTGFNSNNTPVNSAIYTNEEFVSGGIDPTYASQYNLYINEANEVNFLHKKIPLTLNSPAISKLKFEIRENAALIPDAQSALSSGESFWIKLNGNNMMLSQGQVINTSAVTGSGLYYGEPATEGSLGTSEAVKGSSTIVAYEKATDNFVAIFDKGWKNADITIFDMSGKLINSEKKINTSSNHVLNIPKQVNSGYLITIKADNGQVYNTKIMR